MSARALAEDLVASIPLGMLARVFPGAGPLRDRIETSLAQLDTRTEIATELAEKLGQMGLGLVLSELGIETGADSEEMVNAWLAHRLPEPPRPKARPQHLAKRLLQQAEEAEVAYPSAKLVASEFERLMRWMLFFLLQAGQDETERAEPIQRARGAMKDHWTAGDPARTGIASVLKSCTFAQLIAIQEQLDHCDIEPHASTFQHGVICKFMDDELRGWLDETRQGRNVTGHARGGEAEARRLLGALVDVITSWRGDLLIPRGAFVSHPFRGALGDRRLSCIDEAERVVELSDAPESVDTGATVFIASRHAKALKADQLVPVPEGDAWADPPDLDLDLIFVPAAQRTKT